METLSNFTKIQLVNGRVRICTQVYLTLKPMLLTTIFNIWQTIMLNNGSQQKCTAFLKGLEMMEVGEQEELSCPDANRIKTHWKNTDLEVFSLICIPPDIKIRTILIILRNFFLSKILNYLHVSLIHIAFLINFAGKNDALPYIKSWIIPIL